MAVYTIRRNFRIAYGTKTGGYRPLIHVDINDATRHVDAEQTQVVPDREVFLKSMLQRTTVDDISRGDFRLICCRDPIYTDEVEPSSSSDIWYFRLDLIDTSVKRQKTTPTPKPPQSLKKGHAESPNPPLFAHMAEVINCS